MVHLLYRRGLVRFILPWVLLKPSTSFALIRSGAGASVLAHQMARALCSLITAGSQLAGPSRHKRFGRIPRYT